MDQQNTNPQPQPPQNVPSPITEQESDKSYVATWVLSYFVGSLGIDRFYRGFIGTGILKLITLGGFGLWTFIDWIMIGYGHPKDKQGLTLRGFSKNRKTMQLLTTLALILSLIGIPAFILLLVFVAVPALQSGARNVQRKLDATAIAQAVNLFESHDNGQLPTSVTQGSSSKDINLCGTDCSSGGTTTPLSFYGPSKISFQTYSPNLKVPDINTVYIVDSATCNSADTGLNSQTAPNSNAVAVLYALEGPTNTIKQQCLGVS